MTPAPIWKYQWEYVGVLGILLVLGITLLFLKKIRPALRESLSNFAWTNLVLGVIIFFFRYQQIPLLGMDLWRFLQEVEMVIWLIVILRYRVVVYPQEKLEEKVISYKSRFLPKPKRE
ncbi:hypothetical protein KGQ71_02380 [Patescibacteria group bacterium]|nr:hypothetical protein [Patescibacteria group bacterium]